MLQKKRRRLQSKRPFSIGKCRGGVSVQQGRNAIRIRDYNMRKATDLEVFARAAEEDRILISSDVAIRFNESAAGEL